MSDYETIQEIVLKAHRELSPALWDFISGGSESETTLRRNRQALDRLAEMLVQVLQAFQILWEKDRLIH